MPAFDPALLPPRLARRPRDPRGFPITFVTSLQPDGAPDFTAIDQRLTSQCADERRCGLCGEPLGYWVAFAGGPECAVEPAEYIDPGMHVDCTVAALRVCPWLALRNARRRPSKVPVKPLPNAILGRPDRQVVLIARDVTTSRDEDGMVFFHPGRVKFRYDCGYGPDGRLEIPAGLAEAVDREARSDA